MHGWARPGGRGTLILALALAVSCSRSDPRAGFFVERRSGTGGGEGPPRRCFEPRVQAWRLSSPARLLLVGGFDAASIRLGSAPLWGMPSAASSDLLITQHEVIVRILAHLNLETDPPPIQPA